MSTEMVNEPEGVKRVSRRHLFRFLGGSAAAGIAAPVAASLIDWKKILAVTKLPTAWVRAYNEVVLRAMARAIDPPVLVKVMRPLLNSNFKMVPGEIYGRAPGDEILEDVKEATDDAHPN